MSKHSERARTEDVESRGGIPLVSLQREECCVRDMLRLCACFRMANNFGSIRLLRSELRDSSTDDNKVNVLGIIRTMRRNFSNRKLRTWMKNVLGPFRLDLQPATREEIHLMQVEVVFHLRDHEHRGARYFLLRFSLWLVPLPPRL